MTSWTRDYLRATRVGGFWLRAFGRKQAVEFCQAVLDLYLEAGGKPVLVPAIAQRLSRTPREIDRLIEKNNGYMDGCGFAVDVSTPASVVGHPGARTMVRAKGWRPDGRGLLHEVRRLRANRPHVEPTSWNEEEARTHSILGAIVDLLFETGEAPTVFEISDRTGMDLEPLKAWLWPNERLERVPSEIEIVSPSDPSKRERRLAHGYVPTDEGLLAEVKALRILEAGERSASERFSRP